MDNLFRQTRLRFSGTDHEKKEEPGSSKELRIPPQKTQSFKDKKKEPNWFKKQVTWQMSQDHDSGTGDERAAAVAAAAYAITSLRASTVPIASKREDPTISIPNRGRASKKSSGEITQISDNPESKAKTSTVSDAKKPEKALLPTLSFRKTASSLDKQLSGSFRQSSGTTKPDLPTSAVKPARPLSSGNKQPSESLKRESSISKTDLRTGSKRHGSTSNVKGRSQADIWEETELVRIKDRYETLKSTILSWEGKKKTKAKRRLDKTEVERELEQNRAKAIAKYRRDIQNIDQVVGGAKAKADEKKRNDELKVKEKANTIRKTGKVPSTCSCF